MKKLLLSIFIFSTISFETFSHVDHYAKFNYLEYELFRNNTPIGYHKFDFKRGGKNLIRREVLMRISGLTGRGATREIVHSHIGQQGCGTAARAKRNSCDKK